MCHRLSYLLDNSSGSVGKNSITLGENTKYDQSFMTEFLNQMLSSKAFGNAVSNIASGVSVDEAKISQLISDLVDTKEIRVEKIIGNEGSFRNFFSTYLEGDTVVAQLLNATEADIGKLSAEIAKFTELSVNQIKSEDGKTLIDFVNSAIEAKEIKAD